MTAFDFSTLLDLSTLAPAERKRLGGQEEDARWAEYGRAVYAHLMAEGKIETAITRVGLKQNVTVKDIARAVRAYLLTGALP